VHLVRLAPDLVLVVLVSESGRVAKELVRLTRAATAEEITSAEGLLEHALCGKRLQEASLGIAELTSDEPQGVRAVVRAAADVARRTEDVTHDIYLGGTSQLAALWADLDKVHRVLEFLEQQTRLMRVLEQTRGTSVRIGTEVGLDVGDLAVVSTSYAAGSAGEGRVGVIGPKRMDYRRTIRVVEEVGEGLGDSLGG
jgi:heat-inducible transcriptional repressor